MLSRKAWETAGFITIAAALHVSAAAFLLPTEEEAILPPGPVSASLSAGSGELGEMIEKWESQPEVDDASELNQPESPQEPDMQQPEVEEPIETVTPQPAPTLPEIAPSRPNLPEPELPELQSFDPPEIKVDPPLTLAASERPERRPEKPKPEPKRETRSEPQPRREQPARQQQPQQRQAAPSGGQGGGGGGGISPAQEANLKGQWQAQIQSCIARAVQRVNTNSRGGRVSISVNIAPSGAMQSAGLAASSVDDRANRDIMRAVQRARCPKAPRGLTGSFQAVVPVIVQR